MGGKRGKMKKRRMRAFCFTLQSRWQCGWTRIPFLWRDLVNSLPPVVSIRHYLFIVISRDPIEIQKDSSPSHFPRIYPISDGTRRSAWANKSDCCSCKQSVCTRLETLFLVQLCFHSSASVFSRMVGYLIVSPQAPPHLSTSGAQWEYPATKLPVRFQKDVFRVPQKPPLKYYCVQAFQNILTPFAGHTINTIRTRSLEFQFYE